MSMKDQLILSMIGLVLIMWSNPMRAATQVITFEESGINAMENSFIQVPQDSHLDTLFLSTLGVSFSSSAGYTTMMDHDYPDEHPSLPMR